MKINLHRICYPFLLRLIRLQRKHVLHKINDIPYVKYNTIFAINHSCRYDAPIVGEVIGRHAYVLVGKQRLDLMDKFFFRLNGVIYVDRKDKTDRKVVSVRLVKLLRDGQNVCIYPEGTWNLTPSKPMLPLYWGVIDIAKKADVPVIPVILEYKDNDCYVKFGSPVYITKSDNKQNKINELSDKMASLRWEIWEMFPIVSRTEINEQEWEQEVRKRVMEYPKLDYEYEKSCIRNYINERLR